MKTFEELQSGIKELEAAAAELGRQEYHGRSDALHAVRSRLNGALEMCEAHERWQEANPVATAAARLKKPIEKPKPGE
jgi:hypothetical protein